MNTTDNIINDPADKLPLSLLINGLKNENPGFTFNELRSELLKTVPSDDPNNNVPFYHINIKESDDLCILYYNDPPTISDTRDKKLLDLERSCRSVILDKNNLKIIGSQFNRIIYNEEGIEYVNNVDWNNVVVQKCYEGTILLVFNHNGVWYVSTRRCIKSEESSWIKGKTYREMFDESIKNKFTLESLNPNLCYHFVLVHHKNKNIVNYSDLGDEYAEIYHILTTEKYTLNEVNIDIPGAIKVGEEQFENLNSLLNNLNAISQSDEANYKITSEGYVLRVYNEGNKYKSLFTVVKLQTAIYRSLLAMKPNNNNIYQSYLELYQSDKLMDFLPYFNKYSTDIVKRIHTSMKNMAKEMLDLYHSTRKKKNGQLYSKLTDQYKKVLYALHGIYIQQRKSDFVDGEQDSDKLAKSINVHNVYHYLKSLPPRELRQLYFDRTKLIEDASNQFINKNCIYTKTQCTLMFATNN